MPTVFIAGTAVNLPSRFKEGHVLDHTDATLLNQIWLKRLAARLRRLLTLGQIDTTSIDERVREIHAEELAPYSIAQDADDDDPVFAEAMEMARALITQRMAQENIQPPKNLDTHARAVIEGVPAIVEQARMRIEARYNAAASLLDKTNAPLGHTNGANGEV